MVIGSHRTTPSACCDRDLPLAPSLLSFRELPPHTTADIQTRPTNQFNYRNHFKLLMQLWKFYFLLQITTQRTNTNFLSGSSTSPLFPFQELHKTLLKEAILHGPSLTTQHVSTHTWNHQACFSLTARFLRGSTKIFL